MSLSHKQKYWQTLIEQQSQSGLTHAKFCQQNDIKLATFYYWAKKLRTDTVQQVLPIIVNDELCIQHIVITSPTGLRIAFPADLPKAQIRHWLEALA